MSSSTALVGVASLAFVFLNFLQNGDKRRKVGLLLPYRSGATERQLVAAIPTVGDIGGPIGFLIQPIRSLWDSSGPLQEGYDKYRGNVYKFRTMTGWKVAVTSPQQIEDMRKAPDDVLSSMEAVVDMLQMDYTLGEPFHYDPYQVKIVKGTMTRNIQVRFAEVTDEVVTAFSELIPPRDDWETIDFNPTMYQIICRASNRFFLGLPLCRDPDFVDLNIKFTIYVVLSGYFIRLFPNFLKPIVGKIVTPLHSSVKRAKRHLASVIQERFDQEKEHQTPDWPGKPNDMLSWLLEEATEGDRRTIHDLVVRILGVNFGAIHTTSLTLNSTLKYLTRYPEYIPALREEIQSIIDGCGWTKQAMGRMRKLDSFLREVQRFDPLGSFGVERKVLKDFTFSDGTVVPAGTTVGVPVRALQRDEAYFSNGDKFEGFRFADMREEEGESIKHQMVTPTADFFLFGHGRHACPGRFFAVNELKLLVAHILLNYDIKAENLEDGKQDDGSRFLFRKRRT
ncbi:hypothetical protein PQX77_011322 [Marasmius sp. AFHP31]|nr:hypothetical protein PQX77_011322 [Marasmius sp. AFHP31]